MNKFRCSVDLAAVPQLAKVIGADAFLTKGECGTRLNQTIANILQSRAEMGDLRIGSAALQDPFTSEQFADIQQ
jgi:hypothetical protein